MSDETIRVPDEAERAALEAVLQESFGMDGLPWTTWMERVGHENLRVAVEGGAVLGGLGFYRFGQRWGGASIPMLGIAGVGVAPFARGRGVARRFLVSTLAQGRDEGVPLAGLYASSTAVYRSVGFEQAGTVLRWAAPIASLARGDHALEAAPFDPPAIDPALRALYEARARGWSGHLDRNEAIWARITQPHRDVRPRAYRFGPADLPEGYVVYAHTPGESLHFAVTIRDLVLATPTAARRCLALLSDLRSLASELRWLGCASDPLVSLLPEETARVTEHHRWMLRILDPERALAMRGYVADGEARFDVRDPLFGDAGVHLRVVDRRAEVTREPPGRAALTVDARALAALYSGFASPSTLDAMGLVDGDLASLHELARLFAGREPWLCDWF